MKQVTAESGGDKLRLTHISPRHEGDERNPESQASAASEGAVATVRDGDPTAVTQRR